MNNPMRKVALRNLAAHKVRLALTVLSVVLGTAFISGSFVFTDTLQRTFDGIFAGQAQGVDVRVGPKDQQSLGVPNNIVAALAKADGVERVAPAVNGPVVLLQPDGKKAVQTGGAPSFGLSYLPPEQAVEEPEKFVAGAPPSQTGEIALNTGGAEKAGLKVGDKTKVLVPSKGDPFEVTLTGIYEMPGAEGGGVVAVMFTEPQGRKLFTDGNYVAYADIRAAPGVSADDLRDRLAVGLPTLKVQNSDEVREDMKKEISEALTFINYFLLAFGAIALIVGTFIIYNTFSMIVAQRLRELALLRAIGASRQQVGRSVVAEAVVIGLIGSAIGLAAGIALAFGLSALLNAFDLGLPTGSLTVLPRTAIVALLVGLVVTVASAYAPARRAAKVPPVEAMRSEFASAGESLRVRTVIGAVLAVAGGVLVYLGAQGTGKSAAITVGVGALGLILAVLLAAPALSRPVVVVLGVLTRPFGPMGRMARNNAVRNPRRTAATAFALTLGLMLVSAIGILGASAKTSVDVLIDKGVKAEYVLAGPPMIGAAIGAVDAVRQQVPQVSDVTGIRAVGFRLGDERVGATTLDGPIDPVMDIEMREGSSTITEKGMLVGETEAADRGWELGEKVTITSLDNAEIDLTVGGIYADSPLLGTMVVDPGLYEQLMPQKLRTNLIVLVKAQPGADLTAMRANLEKATEPFAVVQVQDHEQFKGAQGQQINTLLAILYGLLALAVVIAVLGIINTLALSVVERRREIGMLRAVGTQRSQIRRTIYLESMLIAIFGAIVGLLLGVALGVGFLRTLRDMGIDQIDIPWSQLVAMLIASGVVGVLAAVWPGVRAARTPPLAAIADL
ncbi:putative ABC transport system permease protein [Nocardia ignorata]|uniref:Putative ABC transport system permease protein n=2 Tax=Nocardia ignorata TaxID=145285 RepID=A0A4R6PUL9_NOCIG|nr:FtsX-like permease family protein [Nocardia ignorata]TDP42252.1 putative ABC transport system permease protein [Nocardia ignorata]